MRCFRCRCGLCKVSQFFVYKMLQCQRISVLFASIFAILVNLEVIEKFQGNKTMRDIVFRYGKFCSIRPRKFHTAIFGRMESAAIVFCVFLVLYSFCSLSFYVNRVFYSKYEQLASGRKKLYKREPTRRRECNVPELIEQPIAGSASKKSWKS